MAQRKIRNVHTVLALACSVFLALEFAPFGTGLNVFLRNKLQGRVQDGQACAQASAHEQHAWGIAVGPGRVAPLEERVLKVVLGLVALLEEALHVFDGAFSQPVALAVERAGRLVNNALGSAEGAELLAELGPVVRTQPQGKAPFLKPFQQAFRDGLSGCGNSFLDKGVSRESIHQDEVSFPIQLCQVDRDIGEGKLRNMIVCQQRLTRPGWHELSAHSTISD